MSSFNCWKCGTSHENIILPMSRREECTQCSADFHVCNMCEFFDLNKHRCDEERAEHISDPERANFCDYFKPTLLKTVNLKRYKSDAAKAKLAELFGDPIPAKKIENTSLSQAELAEKKLREMLGG